MALTGDPSAGAAPAPVPGPAPAIPVAEPFPNSFPLRRYRLELVVTRALRLPAFSGPLLRSVFGNALRRNVCMTGLDVCARCPLVRRCPYTTVFEAQVPEGYAFRRHEGVPNPYVIDPPHGGGGTLAPGAPLALSVTLLGPALAELGAVLLAFRSAFADGVGEGRSGGRGTARLERVVLETIGAGTRAVSASTPDAASESASGAVRKVARDASSEVVRDAAPEGAPGSAAPESDDGLVVLDGTGHRPHAHARHIAIPPLGEPLTRIVLELRTPLRLLRERKPLGPDTLEARDVLAALVRRQASLVEMQLGRRVDADFRDLAARAREIRIERSLRALPGRRYSARQKRSMDVGGLVGSIALEGELAPFWPMLFLGQYLHVGKFATCGNGGYRLRERG